MVHLPSSRASPFVSYRPIRLISPPVGAWAWEMYWFCLRGKGFSRFLPLMDASNKKFNYFNAISLMVRVICISLQQGKMVQMIAAPSTRWISPVADGLFTCFKILGVVAGENLAPNFQLG